MNTEKIPVLYEKGRPQAVFTKAFNVVTVAEVNAESYLEFDIYFTDRKRNYITNQAEIRIDGKAYKIKTVTDNKEHSSAKTTHVYAEELYYDLARAARLESTVFDTAKAVTSMRFALQNTDWDIGTIGINSAKSFESTEENPLALLQLIADI